MKRRLSYRTINRKKILQLLENGKHKTFTISEMLESLNREGIKINASTIYRYMDKLVKEGIVLKYPAAKGEKATFQYVGGKPMCHTHLHMKCNKCDTLMHLDCSFMEEITYLMETKYAFWLECNSSILYGVCKNCR